LDLTTIPYELAISAIGVLVFAMMAAIKAQILYVGLSMFGLYLVYLAILVWKDSQLSQRESCSLLENHHLLDVEGPALSEFTCKESTVKHEGTIFEKTSNDKPDEESIKYKEMNGTLVRKEKSNNYPTTIKGVLDVIKRRTVSRSSGMVWVRKLIYLLELPVIFMM
jgi:membrane protein implicated in regulation of membrane protease activity